MPPGDETVGPIAPPMGYYRHPDHPGETVHECGFPLHEHGWIDSYYVGGEDGITVCPASSGPFQGQTVTERGRQPRRFDSIDDLRADAEGLAIVETSDGVKHVGVLPASAADDPGRC